MRIRIARDLCCGAQTCVEVAPEVYSLNDEGFNALVDRDGDLMVEPALETQAVAGAKACPESALKILDQVDR